MTINHKSNAVYGKSSTVKQAVAAIGPFSASLGAILILVFFDLLAIGAAVYLALVIRNGLLPLLSTSIFTDKLLEQTFELLWWYPLAFIFSFAYEKLYYKRLPYWAEVELIIKASTLAFFMAIAFIYILGLGNVISRAMVIMVYVFCLFLLPVFRYYAKKLLLKMKMWNCPVILIGNSDTAALLCRALTREETMGYQVIGLITLQKEQGLNQKKKEFVSHIPLLGSLTGAEELIINAKVRDVIIAEPGLSPHELVELTNRFQTLVDNVIIVPDLFGISLNGTDMAYLFEEQAILLQIKNRLKSPLNLAVKRIFDIAVGAIIFILSLPLFLTCASVIKFDSAGSAFYSQKRIGQGGKEFTAYKFRTMFINCDQILEQHLSVNEEARREWQKYQKLKTADPRVTRVGHLLRRFSLDELPQLINILKGDMSLVGPRPYLPREEKEIGNWAGDILTTKPGLTGLWQVSGRNKLSFRSRLRLDSWYVKNWSLWLDIILLFKTLRVVLKADGAY